MPMVGTGFSGGDKVPQYDKHGFEFRPGDYTSIGLHGDRGPSGAPSGAYFDSLGGQSASVPGSDSVYRNLPVGPSGTTKIPVGTTNFFFEDKSPLSGRANFNESIKDVEVPGIDKPTWRSSSDVDRAKTFSSIYNPEYAESLKKTGSFTPAMQKVFQALSRGESPDLAPATAPKESLTPYSHGGYTYSGFKNFGDVGGLGENLRKKDDLSIRPKLLNTPGYYEEASKSLTKPGQAPTNAPQSRGGYAGDPARLGALFSKSAWRGFPGFDKASKLFNWM